MPDDCRNTKGMGAAVAAGGLATAALSRTPSDPRTIQSLPPKIDITLEDAMKTTVMLAVLLLSVAAYAQDLHSQDSKSDSAQLTRSTDLSQKAVDRIVKEAHHELVMLPFYGVFDNLLYKVSPDGTVILLGEVSRPTLKSDAERAVRKIEGVERVDNQIKVLPVSPNDDRIRRATYRK